ncbi:uncharacterized protein LOC126834885 isoform X2 [Adelges cooleyi]|uniref:uncharacterized protein LOC126834885 isoform X2 n=1 Tax=Adelges cooleyi TaxID=133065 RepID=UPI00217FE95B|nr:uncharacterized protein LOC126834885 isoform X2 [Adelges cooleyi]
MTKWRLNLTHTQNNNLVLFLQIKMKLLSILILFALVNDLVSELDDFVKQVLITNDHIKLANSHMPKIIKKLLLEKFTMVELVFMLATPENDSQFIKPLERLEYQMTMQSVISAETGIDAPQLKKESLTTLLEQRRLRSTEGLKNKIIRASGQSYDNFLTYLGSERRYITSEAIQLLIHFNEMCRLIGVFRSINYPNSYVDHASSNKGQCFITNVHWKTTIYIIIDGEIWEVDSNHARIRHFSWELQD